MSDEKPIASATDSRAGRVGRAGRAPSPAVMRVTFVLVFLVLYGLLVLVVTLTPTTLDQGYESSISKILAVFHRHGLPNWFRYATLEFGANIAMFVPLGFLLSLVLPSRIWWIAIIACPVISTGIEVAQHLFLSGRFATVSDVIANSAGGAVGAVLALVLRGVVHRRDERVVARAMWESARR
jgi:glycopeptide antibiotics resistance protein